MSQLHFGRCTERCPATEAGQPAVPTSLESLPTLAEHPRFGLNLHEPVGHGGDPAEVFEDVLLTDEPDGEHTAGRERERRAEDGLQHGDLFGVVAEGSVPEVREVAFRGVEPFVEGQILTSLAAELPG